MEQFIGRSEFDDLMRHLNMKIERREAVILDLIDRVELLEVNLIAAQFSIRLLGGMLRPLLPPDQQELLELERRAGVIDSLLSAPSQTEPNDGHEWRERMLAAARARTVESAAPGLTVLTPAAVSELPY